MGCPRNYHPQCFCYRHHITSLPFFSLYAPSPPLSHRSRSIARFLFFFLFFLFLSIYDDFRIVALVPSSRASLTHVSCLCLVSFISSFSPFILSPPSPFLVDFFVSSRSWRAEEVGRWRLKKRTECVCRNTFLFSSLFSAPLFDHTFFLPCLSFSYCLPQKSFSITHSRSKYNPFFNIHYTRFLTLLSNSDTMISSPAPFISPILYFVLPISIRFFFPSTSSLDYDLLEYVG